ncbi:MAG: NAD(P)-dependent oxidoreductase [Planctomycetaceae bacterium]
MTESQHPARFVSSSTEPIGLIGIGLMGTVIAERLLRANYHIIGWDLAPERCRALTDAGGEAASGIAEIITSCRRIVLSLPTHETVAEILQNVRELLRPGHVIIDTSTGDPLAAGARADELSAGGIEYLDATVSGSSAQLRDGTAVLLVGATDAAFLDNRELLSSLGEKIFHTGPPGSGARMKLVTNLVLGLNRAALAEGLCFARGLGLDLDQVLMLLRESIAYSRIMDTKGEKMLRGDFSPQAKLSQHLKDVRLIQSAAREAEMMLPLTETHRRLLEHAEQMGLGDLDNSAILNAIAAQRLPSD